MIVNEFSFGSITIDGIAYHKDIVIDNGTVYKRDKSASKKHSNIFGHTPLSVEENIPWNCRYMVIGTGHNSGLPVMQELYFLAQQKGVKIKVMTTPEAIKYINDPGTNLILHLTC